MLEEEGVGGEGGSKQKKREREGLATKASITINKPWITSAEQFSLAEYNGAGEAKVRRQWEEQA